VKLLDVNVWLAASWTRHAKHPAAKRWTDDYLAAFAQGAELVTLDAGMRTRYPSVQVVVLRR
jgi:hypothetical protein